MNKRKRSEGAKECETSVSTTVQETNIMDVNSDCLAKVFQYLRLRDLLNTSLAIRKSDRLNSVINDVFEKNFARSDVSISNDFAHESAINIQLLERFGPMISKLNLSFRLTNFKNLCCSLVKNCNENVTVLRLHYCFGDDHYRVGKKWICKAHVTEDAIKARQFFFKLATQFPKLERLYISRRGSEFSPSMETWHEKAIPTMTHFKFSDVDVDWIEKKGQSTRFSYKMLKSFLAVNPQLQSLSLPMDRVPNDFISFLNKNLPNLGRLKLRSNFFEGLNKKINDKANILTNLKKLKFKVNNSKDVSDFRFLSKTLESLKVQESTDFIASRLVNMVSQFSALKKLKLVVPSRLYCGYDDDVYDHTISMDGLKHLPSHLKHLTKFVLKFQVIEEMNEYIDELSAFGDWNVNVNKSKGTISFSKP